MKERDLDEFGSLFERAVIPTIEVSKIEIPEIVLLLDFSDRTESCARVAAEIAERFGSRVSARFLLRDADREHHGDAERALQGVTAAEHLVVPGDPVAHLLEIAENERPSLVVAPAPLRGREEGPGAAALGRFVESLLVTTETPTLLVRAPIRTSPFERILAKVPGGRHELIQEFSFAFALCTPGGLIRLLHVIDEDRLEELAEILQLTPDIDTREGKEDLVSAIDARMDHLLEGAVRTAKGAGFRVDAAVRTGDPLRIVAEEAKGMSLLIVATHDDRGEFLESRAYRIIREIPDIPVLAL